METKMICYLCGNEYTVDTDDEKVYYPMFKGNDVCFDCYEYETFTCNDCETDNMKDDCYLHFYEENGKKMFLMLCGECAKTYQETMLNCSKLIEK